MKKNRYILIAVVVLGAIALIFSLTSKTGTFKRSQSDFAVDDTSNITMIFMSDKNNNTLKLSRVYPGYNWLVNDKYPGHRFNISMLLETVLNIAVKEPVPLAARDNVIRNLAVSAVKVEIYQRVYRVELFGIRLFPHEKLTKVYYVGGATQNNRGTYMLMQDSPEPFVIYLPGLRGFVSPRYMPVEKYWRDYAVFRTGFEAIRSVKVEFPSFPDQSYSITKVPPRSIEMEIPATRQRVTDYDTLKVMNFLSSFRNLNFEAILNDMEPFKKDSILATPPFAIITVTDTAGVSRSIKTYHKKNLGDATDVTGKPVPYDLDRAYALVNDGKDFVLIQFFVFDKVLRPAKYFMKGYKEEYPS